MQVSRFDHFVHPRFFADFSVVWSTGQQEHTDQGKPIIGSKLVAMNVSFMSLLYTYTANRRISRSTQK